MQTSEQNFSKNVTVRLLNKDGVEFDSFQMRSGMNLWVFIRKRGHPIGSACSGVGVCAACAVKLTPDSTSAHAAASPQNDFERQSLERHGHSKDERLACLTRVFGDVTVQADYW